VRLLRRREKFTEPDFALRARAFNQARALHRFYLTAWVDLDPVRAGLVSRPEDWSRSSGSSYNEYVGMSADESVSRRTV
jgi:hypothetical protein